MGLFVAIGFGLYVRNHLSWSRLGPMVRVGSDKPRNIDFYINGRKSVPLKQN